MVRWFDGHLASRLHHASFATFPPLGLEGRGPSARGGPAGLSVCLCMSMYVCECLGGGCPHTNAHRSRRSLSPPSSLSLTPSLHMYTRDRQSEFRYWQRKKPTAFLEAKVKNVKFIGELVKFKVRACMCLYEGRYGVSGSFVRAVQ